MTTNFPFLFRRSGDDEVDGISVGVLNRDKIMNLVKTELLKGGMVEIEIMDNEMAEFYGEEEENPQVNEKTHFADFTPPVNDSDKKIMIFTRYVEGKKEEIDNILTVDEIVKFVETELFEKKVKINVELIDLP